jgi:hypothetical protein
LRAAIEADEAAAPQTYFQVQRECVALLRRGDDGSAVTLFALASIAREFADRLEGGGGIGIAELTSWSSLASLLAEALECPNLGMRDPLWGNLLGALYPPVARQ